jgi:hypothetical protein
MQPDAGGGTQRALNLGGGDYWVTNRCAEITARMSLGGQTSKPRLLSSLGNTAKRILLQERTQEFTLMYLIKIHF